MNSRIPAIDIEAVFAAEPIARIFDNIDRQTTLMETAYLRLEATGAFLSLVDLMLAKVLECDFRPGEDRGGSRSGEWRWNSSWALSEPARADLRRLRMNCRSTPP